MNSRPDLLRQRQEILDQIAALGPMRRGTILRRHLPRRHKDGTVHCRGPYHTYTFKDGARTRGKTLRDEDVAQQYRTQIETFRRYQALSAQLVGLSQRLADIAVEQAGCKKNSSPISRPSSEPKRRGSSRS